MKFHKFIVLVLSFLVLFSTSCIALDSKCLKTDPTCNLFLAWLLSHNLKHVASEVYWSDAGSNSLHRINVNGTGHTILNSSLDGILLIAESSTLLFHSLQGTTNHFVSTDLNGNALTSLVTTFASPVGLHFDATTNILYISENTTQTIQAYNIQTLSLNPLATTLGGSGALDMDYQDRLLFMASDSAGSIYKLNLNDADPNATKIQIVTGLTNPVGLAVNSSSKRVCWGDIGITEIRCSNYDGTSQNALITGLSSSVAGIEFDIAAGYIYWADFGNNKIQRANTDGSNIRDLITGVPTQGGISLRFK